MRREEIEMFVSTEIATREIPDSMALFGIEPPTGGRWDSEHQAPPILPQTETQCVFQVHDEHTGYPIDAQVCYLISMADYGTKPDQTAPIKYRHAIEFARRDSTDDIRTKVRAGVKSFEQWLQEHVPVCTLSKTGHCEC